jgi:hypothetical protein
MPLKLNKSIDGVERATVRVEFQIDAITLADAAGYLLERDKVNTFSAMTRALILEAVHSMFHEMGEVGVLDEAGKNISLDDRRTCESRIAWLFPEFGQPKDHTPPYQGVAGEEEG